MNALISIIIPVLNEYKKLKVCLSTLKEQINGNTQFEVIVVDTGSTDGSELLPEEFNFTSVFAHHCDTPYTARNEGVEASGGEILVFLDAKCEPSPTYIEVVSKLSKQGNWDIVAGEFTLTGLNSQSTLAELAYAVTHLRTNPIFNGGEVSALTGNMMVRRDLFYELGKFDEKRSGGDVRFSQLAQQKNKRKVFAPQLIAGYHAKTYTDLIRSVKRDAIDIPHKISITGVRPGGQRYVTERLKYIGITLGWSKLLRLRFFIMYLRWLKYWNQ